MQTITKRFEFDAAHRVMNEKMKCFHLHGHRYVVDLSFSFTVMEAIGYAIDFKEIKRVGGQFVEDYLDHGAICNPQDHAVIDCCRLIGSKFWVMSLNGDQYCNPTVENIAQEIFLAQQQLFLSHTGLKLLSVRLYETPSCWSDCFAGSISAQAKEHFLLFRKEQLDQYAQQKGVIQYDDRK
jgi:6-pyruvoyltetrahydropterin/6-carboxytetrahydropterin synthase